MRSNCNRTSKVSRHSNSSHRNSNTMAVVSEEEAEVAVEEGAEDAVAAEVDTADRDRQPEIARLRRRAHSHRHRVKERKLVCMAQPV